MELPPLAGNYFSSTHSKEHFYRRLCGFLLLAIIFALYIFWEPLRSTRFTYSLVSITVGSTAVAMFFRIITTLGSEGFFLVLLSIVYWSVNKPLGFWGLILMPLSIFVTSEIPKDIIRLPRPDVRGITVPTYTFPSGHTSGAVSVWGYLAILLKRRRFWPWALAVVLLVGLSRVMLGYHYPGDVLGGLITGVLFLALFFRLAFYLSGSGWHERISFNVLLPAVLALPLALSYIPATFAPKLMGYLAGAGTGYLIQREKLNFPTCGSLRRHLARASIGIAGLAFIIPGLNAVLPSDIHLLTFTQHALATFWITYLAPLLFSRTGCTN